MYNTSKEVFSKYKEFGFMSKYIKNMNAYLSDQRIRQKFLSARTGMSEDKISKLLNGRQKVTMDEMELLAEALGKDISFFAEERCEKENDSLPILNYAFYAGEPGPDQVKCALKLVEFLENVDEILSSKLWFETSGVNIYEI